MICSKRQKEKFIFPSFLSPCITKKWWLRVKNIYIFWERKHNHLKNLKRSRKKKAKLECENKKRR